MLGEISLGSSAIFERRSAAFRPLLAKGLAFQDEVIFWYFPLAVPCKGGQGLLNSGPRSLIDLISVLHFRSVFFVAEFFGRLMIKGTPRS